MLLLALACVGTDPGDGTPHDSVDSESLGPQPPTPAAYAGTCPAFGDKTDFESAGYTRKVLVRLPADPVGAPVWFNWHWLGGSANQGLRYQELELATDAGFIVIAPDSRDDEPFEWPFVEGDDPTPDLQLFDDLLSCLHETYQVDLNRVHSTGMSAGGLWTTYLLMNRSTVLASAAPLSGGTQPFQPYTTPERDLPVLITWGGPSDLYNGLSFALASTDLSEALIEDGHSVAHCVHDDGHNLPPGGTEYTIRFFQDHPWGTETVSLNGDAYPDFCGMPQ